MSEYKDITEVLRKFYKPVVIGENVTVTEEECTYYIEWEDGALWINKDTYNEIVKRNSLG